MRRPIGFDLPPTSLATTNGLLEFKNSRNKRRRKLGEVPIPNAVAQLPSPPLPVQDEFVFTMAPNLPDVLSEDVQSSILENELANMYVDKNNGIMHIVFEKAADKPFHL